MNITIIPDGDGYLAEVQEAPNTLYAFGYTEQEALKELSFVVEMVADTFLPSVQKSSLSYA
ncbi:MAG: hypothetical protein WCJ84_05450 [Candidatus Peregrinibacteria bacterium]